MVCVASVERMMSSPQGRILHDVRSEEAGGMAQMYSHTAVSFIDSVLYLQSADMHTCLLISVKQVIGR